MVCVPMYAKETYGEQKTVFFFFKFWRQSLTVQPRLELRALPASQMLGRKVCATTPNNRLSTFGKNEGTSLK